MKEDYHLLVDSIKDYAIYMLEPDGKIASWNAGAERMKGYTEKEIVGQHFSLFFTEDDQSRDKPLKELAVALKKNRYEEEGWRVKKDGAKFWANIIITPIYNEENKHVGFSKITRDLTEKRRQEELYLLLVNLVKEYAIFMLDENGFILTWNEGAERIKGYTAHEIIGKHFSTFYSAEDNAANKPANELEIAIRAGKYEEEGWRITKDGSRFWANVVITPIYTDRHIGYAKVTRDLSRRKEMEQLVRSNVILEATNKELERFAFIASHDLKEPLRKVSTYANLIMSDATNSLSEKQQKYLQKIHSSSTRMKTMIEDILNFSTLSQKQQFEKISLNDVVEDIVDLLEDSIKEKQAVIHYDNLPTAIVVPAQMKQLFQNLISNAIKFSKQGVPPVIDISFEYVPKDKVEHVMLWPAEEYLQITVKDNGIGFNQDNADRIFDLFDRLHSKAEYEGTGMGLAICKKIAENHGGYIIANSIQGEGSTFRVTIPA